MKAREGIYENVATGIVLEVSKDGELIFNGPHGSVYFQFCQGEGRHTGICTSTGLIFSVERQGGAS